MNVTSSPIIDVNNQAVLLSAYAGGPKVTSTVTFSNPGQGTLNVTGATLTASTGNLLTASVASANSITISADPSAISSPGFYTGTVTIASNAANNAQVSIPVEFTVSAAGQPTISQNGTVNIATFQNDGLSQGDIGSIFGDQFTSPGSTFTNTGAPPLATQLGNVKVLVNGVAAPLYFISQQQINFQVPYEAISGQSSTVQVFNNGVASNIRSISVNAAAPRILVWPQTQVPGTYGVIVNSDNTLALLPGANLGSSRLAKPGDVIVMYCIGLGQTTPPAITGAPATTNPVLTIGPKVTVTFGNSSNQVQAQAIFAGLTPTAVGLYQVNVTIPQNTPLGDSIPVSISVGGSASNVVNIPIASK